MPGVRRGAGQPVIQADGRLLESHAGRAPSIKRRSLTPSPLGMAKKAFTSAKEEWEDARQALNTGELQVALRLAKQFTQQYPRVCSGWTLLGRIYRRLNQPDEALNAFRQSLDFANPERHAMILANIGTLLHNLGALGDAESSYR